LAEYLLRRRLRRPRRPRLLVSVVVLVIVVAIVVTINVFLAAVVLVTPPPLRCAPARASSEGKSEYVYERRPGALGTARFLIGGCRNVSIDPSMRQSTRGGAPSSLMAKAIYGHIGKALFHRVSRLLAQWRQRGRHEAARASAYRQPASLQIECDACVRS